MLPQPMRMAIVPQPDLRLRLSLAFPLSPLSLRLNPIHPPIPVQHTNAHAVPPRQRHQLQMPAPLARLPDPAHMLPEPVLHERLKVLPVRLDPARGRVPRLLVRRGAVPLGQWGEGHAGLEGETACGELVRDGGVEAVPVCADWVQGEVPGREQRLEALLLQGARVGRGARFLLRLGDRGVLLCSAAREALLLAVFLLARRARGAAAGGLAGRGWRRCRAVCAPVYAQPRDFYIHRSVALCRFLALVRAVLLHFIVCCSPGPRAGQLEQLFGLPVSKLAFEAFAFVVDAFAGFLAGLLFLLRGARDQIALLFAVLLLERFERGGCVGFGRGSCDVGHCGRDCGVSGRSRDVAML
ncbi:hypothetical protein B5807_11316 [Epicoccum nigrum]|uniref:Uncharacterized protein n=1 Tax=Epicoccum nigrum TaxID=105696 RepID=A0A1Y2LJG3_EPING|nr:hypothetical protein B5807_11316 [Epicoccum nigrum]